MMEAARVYAEALFDVAKQKGKLDAIGADLTQLADAVEADRDLQVFLFSPHFTSAEKVEGLNRALSGADPEQTAADAMATADRVLGEMERGAFTAHAGADRPRAATTDTGWPQDVRRAG